MTEGIGNGTLASSPALATSFLTVAVVMVRRVRLRTRTDPGNHAAVAGARVASIVAADACSARRSSAGSHGAAPVLDRPGPSAPPQLPKRERHGDTSPGSALRRAVRAVRRDSMP